MTTTESLPRLKKIQFWLMMYLFFALAVWATCMPWLVAFPPKLGELLPITLVLFLVGLPIPVALAWFFSISKKIYFSG